MKYTTFFVSILFLFLSATLFTSCEKESLEQESSLHELTESNAKDPNGGSIKAIDKDEVQLPDERD
ncbi:hypothetical protein [Aquimarina rhabdastrellae]